MLPLLFLAATVSCPVLTTPTARSALGDLDVKVTRADKGYTCHFTGEDFELTIEISPVSVHFPAVACQDGRTVVPLKGIGNEAIACTVGTAETIAGRVRNQAFLLRLTKPSHGKLRDLAETVAGNLF